MKILKEESGNFLTFKQLVKLFSEANTEEDFWKAASEIDKSFQADKINWNDHQMLYRLSDRIGKAVGADIVVVNRK